MKFQEFMDQSQLIEAHQNYQKYFAPLRKELKANQLSVNESLVLLALFFEKGAEVHPHHLQRTLNIPKDQISQALKGLLEARLVRSEVSRLDRRKRRVQLTKRGENKAPRLIQIFDFWEQKAEKH